ncbi:MAG: hypothetical protein LBS46_07835 [Dysgonamonadaceae bacterium]|jgi:hypothetical protein|nr:hypothetical protein [Dysgonamonadaceae bacterium]
MKTSRFIPLVLCAWLLSLAACEDELKPRESIDDLFLVGTTLDRLEEDWGIAVKSRFEPKEYSPVSEGYEFPYTEADSTKVDEFLGFFERQILSIFPQKLFQNKMPPKVLLVDSLYNTFTYNDKNAKPPEKWEKRYTLPGNVTGEYLVIGNIGERLDTTSAQLRFDLISLLVERLLNNKEFPEPNELRAVSEAVASQIKLTIFDARGGIFSFNYPYWSGKTTDTGKSWSAAATVPVEDKFKIEKTLWQGLGILNMGRRGYASYEDATLLGYRIISFDYSRGTLRQDFADFAALILTTTPAEREAIFAAVEANTACLYSKYDPAKAETQPWITTDDRDTRFPFGGKAGADAMREKVRLVKAYFKTHLNMTLPE